MFCPKRCILYNAELLGNKQKKKKAAFSQGKRVRHWSMAVAGIFTVNFFSGESNIHHKLLIIRNLTRMQRKSFLQLAIRAS